MLTLPPVQKDAVGICCVQKLRGNIYFEEQSDSDRPDITLAVAGYHMFWAEQHSSAKTIVTRSTIGLYPVTRTPRER